MDKTELYLHIAHEKFSEQYRRGRAFDARAGAVLGVAPTLAGIAAIVLKDFSGQQSLSGADIVATIVLGAAMVGAMLCALLVLKPQNQWRHDPDLKVFGDNLGRFTDDEVVEWAGEFTRDAVEVNNGLLTAKGRRLVAAVWFLVAMAAALVTLAVLVNT